MTMQTETRSEKNRRLYLGCIWVGASIVWWLGSVIPVIYVVASAPKNGRSLIRGTLNSPLIKWLFPALTPR